jgi:SAM-dependent methyltransferase
MNPQSIKMTKHEIAESLGITIDTVSKWADKFGNWLDVDSRYINKIHDEKDLTIFRIIQEIDTRLPDNYGFAERMAAIERELWSSPIAISIRKDRTVKKAQPEIVRWDLISTHGFSLSREYGWLTPLRSYAGSIADFGCWATRDGTCSEPYALLWALNASKIVVIEKNSEYIRNAKEWLESTRSKHSFFEDYNIIFVEGDMRDSTIAVHYAGEFELAYCCNVLYFMQDNFVEMQTAINTMRRVVKPGGWLIAIEGKIGVKYKETSVEIIGGVTIPSRVPENEPTDISYV